MNTILRYYYSNIYDKNELIRKIPKMIKNAVFILTFVSVKLYLYLITVKIAGSTNFFNGPRKRVNEKQCVLNCIT